MFTRTLILSVLLAIASATGFSQGSIRSNNSNSVSAEKSQRDSDPSPMGSPEQEMLARQSIKAAEKDFRENLERAREAAQLGAELRDAFEKNKAMGRVETRKLERLEKITRKIRSEAGGSDGDITLENPPSQIEPALSRLAEASEKLRQGVEKTSRHVISASVIEEANEVLELLRYIRGFTHTN